MYEFDDIKKLLTPSVAKALTPIPATGEGSEPDASTYDKFSISAAAFMSSEYGENIESVKGSKWVPQVFAFTLDFLVSSTLSGISEALQKKIADNYKVGISIIHENRNSAPNVNSRVGYIADAYS